MNPHLERPSWVRRLNQFGPATGDARLIVPLDPEELLALARSSTGLEEIGDPAWHETFARRIRSIDQESNANLLGRLLCRAETIRVLQTRLRLYRAWAETPEILEERIERPIFILGAPRTGTTILLELLALDPKLRAPIAWEAHHPLPHGAATDPASSMALAEAEQELWADIQPELMTLHELRSDLPCECIHFMSLDFGSNYWAMHYATPSFDAWAGGQPDLVARTYRLHHRFLQTLQYDRAPRRWLLKSPTHLITVRELLAEYPDAVLVQTHRDPFKFVGSTASTTTMLNWLRTDSVDHLAQGRIALAGFALLLNQVRTFRSDGTCPDDQFVDIHYVDLISDPIAAVRRIYDQSGLDWPSGHEKAIASYLEHKPKAKFGKHEYRLEDYGLDEELVRSAYSEYITHYGIEPES
jgi:hypothetical protein